MTGVVSASIDRPSWRIPGWAPAVLLLIGTFVLGPKLGSSSRLLFVLGCGAAGWYAWRRGPAEHFQAALVLFLFAPMVRRVVDLSIGFDEQGLMLVGPLLAILAAVPRFEPLLEGDHPPRGQLGPMLLVGVCVVYAAMLSLAQGNWTDAASGVLKWMAPLWYGIALSQKADRDEMLAAATSAFVVVLPVTGLIGIYQYVNPPDWDRYWMQFAPIMSVGQPEPYGVRVFSTMNGPASFATFTAAGLLLVCFLRAGWVSALLSAPAALALLLSLYRTAWFSLAAGILLCLLFAATRRRAAVILVVALAAVAIAAISGPFADVIGDRLASFNQGSQDGSVQERLQQYVTLWSQWDSSLFGVGFTKVDVGTAGATPVDGMIIACWLSMGIVAGLVCLAALICAAVRTVAAAWRDDSRESIVLAALGCGALVQLPLANLTAAEFGFLFWTMAVLATAEPRAPASGYRT